MAYPSYRDLNLSKRRRQEFVSSLDHDFCGVMANGWGASNGSLSFTCDIRHVLVQTRVSKLYLRIWNLFFETSVKEYIIELLV